MEEEQERREKIEGMTRTGRISPQAVGTATSDAMTTSVAEKTGNTFLAGNNSVHSDVGHSNSNSSTEGRVFSKEPIHYGYI